MSATTRSQEFKNPGSNTFIVPTGVTLVWVTGIGGGGGGAGSWKPVSSNNENAAGGGSGEFCIKVPVHVTSGASIPVVIGAAGARSTGTNGGSGGKTAGDGGDTSFLWVVLKGGKGGTSPFNDFTGKAVGGNGGGVAGTVAVRDVPSTPGSYEGGGFWGGGCGGNQAAVGADAINNNPGGARPSVASSGGGGASSPWGRGGTGGVGTPPSQGDGAAAGANAYGAGGGGGGGGDTVGSTNGATGASGYLLIEWEQTP